MLSLIGVMKIVRLTSLLPDMPRLSSPNPRLSYGRRLVHLSLSPQSNPKSVYSFLRSAAGSSSSSPNFPNCSSPRESAPVFADYLTSHFSASRPKALRSRVRDYLSSSMEPRALRILIPLFADLSSPLNFSWLPQTSPRPMLLAQIKSPIPC